MPNFIFTTAFSQGRNNADIKVELLRYPDTCPICKYSMQPTFHLANKIGTVVETIFRCARNDCGSFFIVYYRYSSASTAGNGIIAYGLSNMKPISIDKRDFSSEINGLSGMFVTIYNQAKVSEEMGLDQIAGVGYRKALEFLIKDYLILNKGFERETIESKFLGRCIDEHIENQNIKKVSARAIWLGNDEAHYVRKWEDRDINDLKSLIDLAVYWIDSEILTAKLIEEMP